MAGPGRVVGLIGSIGGGKSEAAAAFRAIGVRTVSADELAHRVLDLPDTRRRLVRWLGPEVVRGGRVDRAAVAGRVFADPEARAKLERLIHPRVKRALAAETARAKRRGILVVLEVPLLLETGTDRWCDAVVYVDAPRKVREARVRASRGWTAAELARRERAQWPARRKRARADYVIDNGGSRAALRKRIEEVHRRLVSRGT